MNEAIRDAVARGVAFIEANLRHEIGVSDVANAAHYSQFYFSREFTRHTHISVYDYILRRKLSESYKELFQRKCKIVDLACRYGFQSHEVYTRAFRKVFAENPSEATVYKPLALYEAISEPYLNFLSGLRIDRMNDELRNCRFEVTGTSPVLKPGDESSALILISPNNPYQRSCILRGALHHDDRRSLSFRFSGLRWKLRVHHTDMNSAFRYYIDHLYDPNTMHSNAILLQFSKNYIDVSIPNSQ
jgi:AraC-like DNA-binding protein